MIKIIRHGRPKYRATCKYCDCLFSFEGSDIEIMSDPPDWVEYIDCPECGGRINIVNRALYQFKQDEGIDY